MRETKVHSIKHETLASFPPCDGERSGVEGLVSKRRDRPYQAGRFEMLAEGGEPKPSGNEQVMESLA